MQLVRMAKTAMAAPASTVWFAARGRLFPFTANSVDDALPFVKYSLFSNIYRHFGEEEKKIRLLLACSRTYHVAFRHDVVHVRR